MISTSKPDSLLAYAILVGMIICLYSLYSPFLENMKSLKIKRDSLEQKIVLLEEDNLIKSRVFQKNLEDLNSLSATGLLHRSSEIAIQVETAHGFIKDTLKAHQGRVLQFQTSTDEQNAYFTEANLDISFVLPVESFPSFIAQLNSSKMTGTIESLMLAKTNGGQLPSISGHLRIKILSVDNASIPVNLDFRPSEIEETLNHGNGILLSGLLNRQFRQAIRSEDLEHLDLLGITLSDQSGSALFRDSVTNETVKINSGEHYFDWKLVEITANSVSLEHSQSNSSVRFDLRKD